jgi:uncharacterized protein YndB with AHSA1/START domain
MSGHPPAADLDVRILGPFEVVLGGDRLDLGSPRQQVVLAVLALEANRLVPVGRLGRLRFGSALDRPGSGADLHLRAAAALRRAPVSCRPAGGLRSADPRFELARHKFERKQLRKEAAMAERANTRSAPSAEYREVVRPERLVFTTGDPANDDGLPASVVTVTLTDLGGKTEMHFHQAGVNTDEAHAEAAKAGWIEFFDRLAEHLAAVEEQVT